MRIEDTMIALLLLLSGGCLIVSSSMYLWTAGRFTTHLRSNHFDIWHSLGGYIIQQEMDIRPLRLMWWVVAGLGPAPPDAFCERALRQMRVYAALIMVSFVVGITAIAMLPT